MKRLRFLRVLLPALLIPFLLLVAFEIRRRPKPWNPPEARTEARTAATGIEVEDFEGNRLRLYLKALRYLGDDGEGRSQFEGVERLLVGREETAPLEIRANRAEVEGPPGERRIRLVGSIEVNDPEAGYRVRLPGMEVDEALGEARAVGQVEFEAPGYQGTAQGLVYGLKEQPSELFDLDLRGTDGGSFRADRAVFRDKGDQVELVGNVRVIRDHHDVRAPRMIVFRNEDGSLRRVEAFDDVVGVGTPPDREAYAFHALEMFCQWSDDGEPQQASLLGQATLQQGRTGLAADAIRVRRRRDGLPGWEMDADGGVFGKGILQGLLHTLQADRLHALADPEGVLESGFVEGAVRFEGRGSVAQAARAEIRNAELEREIHLLAGGDDRARIASDRQRIAADRIVLRPGGAYLRAEGRVETTMLPAPGGETERAAGLFEVDRAVHFVARGLESSADGSILTFRGGVRGWQGDRTLAADLVVIERDEDRMHGEGNVSLRVPRISEAAVAARDFVTVSATEMDYDGGVGQAEFRDDVRVRQQEGWLEAQRLEVELDAQRGGAKVIRAFEDVRLEFRSPDGAGGSEPVSGEADRAEFLPDEQCVRLFGDSNRASVRRQGNGEVTTFGRVLRYRVDTGAVEVESGERDRSKVRTSGPP